MLIESLEKIIIQGHKELYVQKKTKQCAYGIMLQESPQQKKSVSLWFKFHLYNSINTLYKLTCRKHRNSVIPFNVVNIFNASDKPDM